MDKGAWWAAVHGLARVGHDLATKPLPPYILQASQEVLVVKNPPSNAGDLRDLASIPGSGRSPGGGRGNSLQYFCLGNPMDRGAWSMRSRRVRHDLATKQQPTVGSPQMWLRGDQRWRVYPELFRWAPCNHRVLMRGRPEGQRCDEGSRAQSDRIAGWKEATAQEDRQP